MKTEPNVEKPQCRYFVQRKKRLCRMTVRPGKQYCGEHEPDPQNVVGAEEPDIRVPCPLDSKHTCYVSKLEKHLLICNARQGEVPEYIVHNINAPTETTSSPRKPLSQIPKEDLYRLIDKVNNLYEKLIEGQISTLPERDIHEVVVEELSDPSRTESSRRHLRQASALLQLAEGEGLVQDQTCYVELGAGKGHLSYYVCRAWCSAASQSGALLVDRAALRHKRDNKLRARTHVTRLRADLAHLALHRVPAVTSTASVLGLAKHLCGVATDYALRCISADGVLERTRGVVLATCCHHRCERAAYIATTELQKLGITDEDFTIMLGVVSWATCGDGRSRDNRLKATQTDDVVADETRVPDDTSGTGTGGCTETLSQEDRARVGRRAKCVLDWGRVLHLRGRGFDARLCYYVPTTVSLENVCIVAKKS